MADAGGGRKLEEVTVTAQRREEDVQKVPIAITTISDERLDAMRSGADDIRPQQDITLVIRRNDGSTQGVTVLSRIDTPIEVDYFKHGGILPYVLRELVAAA